MKVRLKPFSVPTIHISRSKYDKIFPSVTSMTLLSQTEKDDETLSIETVVPNMSTNTIAMNCDSNMNISKIVKDSTINDTLQIDQLQLDTNINTIKLLPSTSLETDIPLHISPSDTPKEIVLKKKILSLGRSLAEKSTNTRKLQKKIWNQQKQIFKLKSVIRELSKKYLISSDDAYTIIEEFGQNEQLINRLFKKSTKTTVEKQYQEEIRKFAITLHFFSGKAYNYVRKKFYNCLPHPKTLSKWYSTVDASPGLFTEVLKMIKTRAKNSGR